MMDAWVSEAVRKIEADYQRSSDTHMIKLRLPGLEAQGVELYLKDESTHPTGSLKHRLARSLFLYALCNGKIRSNTTIVEASSGSTAVSEAYFAQMLALPFIAVMPKNTAHSKIAQIQRYGGRCHFVDHADQMHEAAKNLADAQHGYFMDQFLYAERATDWRGNNNIADSIFQQLSKEPRPIPEAIVMSAGTGGTSATLGRYVAYRGYATELIVADPEYSVYYDFYHSRNANEKIAQSSRIEGIGRPQVEASFQADVINQMIKVSDADSVATMLWLFESLGVHAGPSTGTNVWATIEYAKTMLKQGRSGSIVTVQCDSGLRYLDTYYDPHWRLQNIGECSEGIQALSELGWL